MSLAAQPDEAIAQVLPLQQHEKGKDCDQNDRNDYAQQTVECV